MRDRVGGGVGLTHEDWHPDTSEQIPERPGLAGADLSLRGVSLRHPRRAMSEEGNPARPCPVVGGVR